MKALFVLDKASTETEQNPPLQLLRLSSESENALLTDWLGHQYTVQWWCKLLQRKKIPLGGGQY